MLIYNYEWTGRGDEGVFCALVSASQTANVGRDRGRVDGLTFYTRSGPHPMRLQLQYPDPQFWQEGRPTPTLRTWREGVAVCGWASVSLRSGARHHRVVSGVMTGADILDLRRNLRPWGLSVNQLYHLSPLVLVYPALYVARVARRPHDLAGRLLRHLETDVTDREAWSLLADRSEDAGDEPMRARAHAALAALAAIEIDL